MIRTCAVLGAAAALLFGCASADEPGEDAGSTDESNEVAVDEPEPEPEPDSELEPEPEPEPEPDPEPTEEVELGDAALRYFEAFATNRPGTMQPMLDESADGSPAAVYAAVQIAFASALQQEGFPLDPSRLTVTDTGVKLCNQDPDRPCTMFDELQVDGSQLSSFTADGIDVTDRLAAGGQVAERSDTTVELVGAYHSVQADSLIVALDVRNDSDETLGLNPYSAEYVTVDGRQVNAADAYSPIDLRPDASAFAVLIFPTQGVGGSVYLTGYDEDFVDSYEWELQLEPMDG